MSKSKPEEQLPSPLERDKRVRQNNNIYILSAPVQSGKTSLLMNWVKNRTNVGGILTPEIEGKRKLFDIAVKMYHELEADDSIVSGDIISVGRFHFYKNAFDHAQKILIQSLNKNPDWLIVDEAGKLELYEQKGLEPAVTHLINHYKNKNITGKLLLIIRDSLLNECIEHYGLQQSTILNNDFFSAEQRNDLYGLVICGGESLRMGTDKSLINYHGKPQRYYLNELLQSFCEKVCISCNKSQAKEMEAGYEIIIDAPQYQNTGPMAALLSAYEKYPDKSFLAIGCDYPFIGKTEIQDLIDARDKTSIAVCYQNRESITEPLLALYEKEIFQLMKNNFAQQKYSLRYFLDEINAKKIFAKGEDALRSIDTPEEVESVMKKIRSQVI